MQMPGRTGAFGLSGARVIGGHEPPKWVLGTEPRSSARAAHALYH